MQTTLSLEDDSMEATSVTKIGIIGVGNVGSMILEVLSNSEHSGGYLFNIFNRSIDKIRKYESSENIKICSGVQDVYSSSDFTFICVKPQQSA
ncbi:MAG TPA: hypothetical protein DHW87_03720, partial [Fervidobacterium sp.]|nr:hypothetical protein [Fervidobacterium sp.]